MTILTNNESISQHLCSINTAPMKPNMGTLDRVLRIAVAVVIAALYFTGRIPGTLGIVLLVVAAVFTLTGLVSFCPLYPMLGISTRKK